MKQPYEPKIHLKPHDLQGISNDQIDDHWGLYVGYVNNVNQLNDDLAQLRIQQTPQPLILADRRRRYGFEYNGMVLHEYFFENLTTQAEPLNNDSLLYEAICATWGSFDAWKQDFIQTGKSRGIGWAILYADPYTRQLTNHFIMDHENGPIARFVPILVMDVWEHAYMVDHKAQGRPDYITAFMNNINWKVTAERFSRLS